MANEWPKTPGFITYDPRVDLAKLIYGMTNKQQRRFRDKFPPGIADRHVGDAIVYARKITGLPV